MLTTVVGAYAVCFSLSKVPHAIFNTFNSCEILATSSCFARSAASAIFLASSVDLSNAFIFPIRSFTFCSIIKSCLELSFIAPYPAMPDIVLNTAIAAVPGSTIVLFEERNIPGSIRVEHQSQKHD